MRIPFLYKKINLKTDHVEGISISFGLRDSSDFVSFPKNSGEGLVDSGRLNEFIEVSCDDHICEDIFLQN